MRRYHYLLSAAFLLALMAGCGGTTTFPAVAQRVFDLGPLPRTEKRAAALDTIDGALTDPAYPVVGGTIQGTELGLDATGRPVAWGLYSYAMPAGHGLGSLHVEASGEFYVALSNYNTNRWEWHGPYADAVDFTPAAGPMAYANPGSGNFYWAVATASGKSVQVIQSVVNHAGLQFRVPPPGEATIETATMTQPSLVQMPSNVVTAEPGAPVMAYLDTAATAPGGLGHQLKLAYYDGAAWQTRTVADTRLLCNPQIAFSGNQGYIVAGDTVALQTVAFVFDWEWQPSGEELVAAWPGGDQPVQIDIALSPIDGSLGVIHGYKGNQVLYSTRSGGTWTTDPPLPMTAGDGALGVSCAFAADGTPWAAYAHGLFKSQDLSLTSTLEIGSRTGVNWTFTPQPMDVGGENSNPVVVDLGFNTAGAPQLVFSSSRLASINIPFVGEYTPPTLTDVMYGSYDAGNWTYTRLFTSSFDSSLNIILMNMTMDLDMGPLCGWAGPDALWFNKVQGDVTIHFNLGGDPLYTFIDPDVPTALNYLERNGASFDPSANFTGQNGSSFSWSTESNIRAAAYIGTGTVNVEQIIQSGQPSATGDLVYWETLLPGGG
jgi:hypothetical protein